VRAAIAAERTGAASSDRQTVLRRGQVVVSGGAQHLVQVATPHPREVLAQLGTEELAQMRAG